MQNLFLVMRNLSNQKISKFSAALMLATSLAVLAGCGSGQAIPTVPVAPPSTDPTTGPAVASIQLLSSSPQIASSGATTIDLTAVVLSATKQTISGKTVTFDTSTDTSAFVNNVSASGKTDSNGLVTAKLNLGSDKGNRTIAVAASADSASTTNSVDVTGTTMTVSGNASLAAGASTTLTFSLKDSAGVPIPNKTVTVASKTGNTIVLTPATGITNNSGQISALITATAAGNDTITASAAGASVTKDLKISSATFGFTTPAANAEIPLGTAQTVTVNWTDTVTPPSGNVLFSISRGTASAASVPLVGGNASITVSSTTAGPAIITAAGATGTPAATLDVIFVTTSASTATVQAVPGTVQVTTGSSAQTNNSSTISVQVRDAANNLVKNAGVTFTIISDPTGGRLTSSSGTTDVSGSASVTYIAGNTSSAQNGVTIRATVSTISGAAITPVSGNTSLTVSGQSLQVRLGTDNLVGGTAPINTKTYVAIVTDAGGNPVVGTTVNFAVRPGRYAKGTFVGNATTNTWDPNRTATCPNEDLNFNGILDPGEGLVAWPPGATPALRPGTVASVNATGVTDAAGVATATITYAKSYSYWAEITLSARTSVTTNDPPTEATFWLSGPSGDYTPLTKAPPGMPSPFGSNATCADTL